MIMCMSQLLQNKRIHTHTNKNAHKKYIVSHAVGLVTHRFHNHDHGQNHKTPSIS